MRVLRNSIALVALCAPLLSPDGASAQARQAKTSISEFVTGPFPYDGVNPGTGRPFFDVTEAGRRGRNSVRGQVYWENETYNDQRVLLHIPAKFDARRPGVMVVFFHGHGAKIERDIRDRQQVPDQISSSVANAVLVAPQFAVDAVDSSPGSFWERGAFSRFLNEAATHLAILHGDKRTAQAFANMPVIVVAYSGGYLPTAWALHNGDTQRRVKGVVLLDALYGELDKFEKWIEQDRSRFFISAYLNSTRARNAELQRLLKEKNIPFKMTLDRRVRAGSITFLSGGGDDETHRDYVSDGWVANPISDLLNRLREYKR